MKKGVLVKLKNGAVVGKVESVKDDKVIVIFGNVKTTAELKNLIIEEKKPKKSTNRHTENKQEIGSIIKVSKPELKTEVKKEVEKKNSFRPPRKPISRD
ncbi:MAG: hypothetical protein IPK10_12635 [Bacteroidetes bacterium]|nr:hypothetical protein [Bacteroidota bacterium]